MLILCTIWIGSPKRQVLALYERPYDELFPVVCVDESPKQLIEITHYWQFTTKDARIKLHKLYPTT